MYLHNNIRPNQLPEHHFQSLHGPTVQWPLQVETEVIEVEPLLVPVNHPKGYL